MTLVRILKQLGDDFTGDVVRLARWQIPVPVVLSVAKRKHWIEAWSWLAYTLFGGLIPFWGTALILLFVSHNQPFQDYLTSGELAVFCAGLVSAAIPVMRQDVRAARVNHPGWFHFLALLILAVVFMLFASVTLARLFDVPELNKTAVAVASVILFLASIAMSFFVELIRNVRVSPDDVAAFDTLRESTLESRFDAARQQSIE